MTSAYDRIVLTRQGPHGFRRAVQRLLIQNRFQSFSIDGPGDGGGDLYCERDGERWIVQCKWKSSSPVTRSALAEVQNARTLYDAHQCVVATNSTFSRDYKSEASRLQDTITPVISWDGADIEKFAQESSALLPAKKLRPYQEQALLAIKGDLEEHQRSLLFLATGLGKTVVAGAVIRDFIQKNPTARILVLAHMVDLIDQLERALWGDIPLKLVSQQVIGGSDFVDAPGLTVASNLSIEHYLDDGYFPDLVVIDECHHVGGDNAYSRIFERFASVPVLGVTATPWRGDGFSIQSSFGMPSFTCGIEEGMKEGYLSPVDYHLFCDNIEWDSIPIHSRYSYSIKELNRKLFIPQRDEQIIDAISANWLDLPNPKCIVFCQSIEHAKNIHTLVTRYERWSRAEILHSQVNKNERRFALLRFRSTDCPMLIAVDILNEGVDVPDVNLVCFARVTHSRKIFVQQLGRGLRLAEGKEKVVVLDFAADARRLAALYTLQTQTEGSEVEHLGVERNRIIFSDQRARSLIEEWITDAANLETLGSERRLQFPNFCPVK